MNEGQTPCHPPKTQQNRGLRKEFVEAASQRLSQPVTGRSGKKHQETLL
jgi:hypothetical protein